MEGHHFQNTPSRIYIYMPSTRCMQNRYNMVEFTIVHRRVLRPSCRRVWPNPMVYYRGSPIFIVPHLLARGLQHSQKPNQLHQYQPTQQTSETAQGSRGSLPTILLNTLLRSPNSIVTRCIAYRYIFIESIYLLHTIPFLSLPNLPSSYRYSSLVVPQLLHARLPRDTLCPGSPFYPSIVTGCF